MADCWTSISGFVECGKTRDDKMGWNYFMMIIIILRY